MRAALISDLLCFFPPETFLEKHKHLFWPQRFGTSHMFVTLTSEECNLLSVLWAEGKNLLGNQGGVIRFGRFFFFRSVE